jgi:hypothetical protein
MGAGAAELAQHAAAAEGGAWAVSGQSFAHALAASPSSSMALFMVANGLLALVTLVFFVPEAPYGRCGMGDGRFAGRLWLRLMVGGKVDRSLYAALTSKQSRT